MKKLQVAIALAATIGAAATTAPAIAQRGAMAHADANGDGAISRDEYKIATDARFARMDANGDGVLSGDEMTGPGGHGGGMMTRADANGDGKLSREEFAAAAAVRFARMDANHDGMIAAGEVAAMVDHARAMRGANAVARAPSDAAAADTNADR